MGKLHSPFSVPDLLIKPPLSGSPNISDDIQQTLATLLAADGENRRILRCTPRGLLQVVNPLAIGFINVGGLGENGVYDGLDVPCSEVVVRADDQNNSKVWVNLFAAAAVDTGWPLAANEHITLTLTNMLQLRLLIVGAAEKVIILYTQ